MLTVVHLITGLETGGAEGMLTRLVTRCDPARFHSVVVSMTDGGTMGPEIAAAGIALRTLNIRRGLPDPRALWRLRRVLREFQPDILQTWLYHADLLGLAVWRLGWVPHVLWNLRCSESIGSEIVRRLLARWSGLPDAVIVNSLDGQRFHETMLGYRPKRWVHLPNGFDTAALRPSPADRVQRRAELGLDDEAIAILSPARYHPMKDHATFLAAAGRLAATHENVRFVLVGAGITAENRELTELIAANGVGGRVLLLGERRDLAALYPACDVVTLSSAFGEGFPNVLGEAMGLGIPCVATDVGDAAAIVGDTGIIVPPRDPAALAAGWERLIGLGAEGRRALGAAARARIVAHNDLGAIVERYQALYETVAGRETRATHSPASR
jgi:glycosyltransferase involved in cell wall biosynthesis